MSETTDKKSTSQELDDKILKRRAYQREYYKKRYHDNIEESRRKSREQARKWRNGEKLSEIRSTLRGSAGKFNELIEKMDALYKTVKKYEDTDDLFCARASKLKTDNTTF